MSASSDARELSRIQWEIVSLGPVVSSAAIGLMGHRADVLRDLMCELDLVERNLARLAGEVADKRRPMQADASGLRD